MRRCFHVGDKIEDATSSKSFRDIPGHDTACAQSSHSMGPNASEHLERNRVSNTLFAISETVRRHGDLRVSCVGGSINGNLHPRLHYTVLHYYTIETRMKARVNRQWGARAEEVARDSQSGFDWFPVASKYTKTPADGSRINCDRI